MKSRVRFDWKSILLFAICGPPLGFLLLMILMMVGEEPMGFSDFVAFIAVGTMFSYMIGGIPALIAGVFYAITARLAAGGAIRHPLARMMVGAVSGFVSSLSLLWLPLGGEGTWVYSGIGMASGAVCGLIRRGRARAENSAERDSSQEAC